MAELLKWIQENVPGILGRIILAVVIGFLVWGWLSDHKEMFKPVFKRFTAAKTHKTEYLTKGPVRVREKLLFRDKLVKMQSKQIRKAMKTKDNKFLIHGFGGVGKTAVAVALYDELENQCERIGWVECRESGNLKASLLTAIRTENWNKTPEERFAEIESLLRDATGETILFLDNVDRPDAMLTELPRYKITGIVTSRMETVDGYTPMSRPPLSEDECVELFRSYCSRTVTEQDEPVVRELVRLVSCHTLSVELLAKGVPAKSNLAEYREQLKEEGFGFLDLEFQTGHEQTGHDQIGHEVKPQTVVEHLKKLFDMAKLDEEQTRVMQNLALMADSRTLPAEVYEWICCDINTLQSFVNTGWITQTEDGSNKIGYEVHPIVRDIVLLNPVPVAAVKKFLYFVAYEEYFKDGEDYRAVQFKLGIVETVLEKMKGQIDKSRDTIALYTSLGNIYSKQGYYTNAKFYYKKALDIAINVLGEEDTDTAISYNNLGAIYYKMGEYRLAENYYERALEIDVSLLGGGHASTAIDYNNLGNVYCIQGKYDVAEECFKLALNIWLKGPMQNSEKAAVIYNNLGVLYDYQGKYPQAKGYYQEALNIRKKALRPNGLDIADSYNNLGNVCRNEGDYSEAKKYHRKALNIRRKLLEPNHLDIAASYNNLGNIYGGQKKYAHAKRLHKKALDIRLKALGANHPDTAASYNNLGNVYKGQKKYVKAVEQYLKAWKIWQQKLGPKHLNTKIAINNLRNCFPHIDHGDQDFDTWLSQQ